jgi:hypothetical protein
MASPIEQLREEQAGRACGADDCDRVRTATAAVRRRLLREVLQTVRATLDDPVALRHLFAGGSSPVVTRQIRDAAARAPIAATAPSPA